MADDREVGDPPRRGTSIGPVVSARCSGTRSRRLIKKGIEEGATLVAGGPGRPEGLDKGYYVRPTIFANVTNDMTIAREEIFGPVLSHPRRTRTKRRRSASPTTRRTASPATSPRGTARARRAAWRARIRAGNVNLNGARHDVTAPFGGYKQSGNGREWGAFGFEEFLEAKAVFGADARAKAGVAEMPA